jgi:hypothetical protein
VSARTAPEKDVDVCAICASAAIISHFITMDGLVRQLMERDRVNATASRKLKGGRYDEHRIRGVSKNGS